MPHFGSYNVKSYAEQTHQKQLSGHFPQYHYLWINTLKRPLPLRMNYKVSLIEIIYFINRIVKNSYGTKAKSGKL